MVERKCKHCKTWNKDEDHCTNCGMPLSPKAIARKEAAEKEPEGPSLPEQILIRAREARYVISKLFFYTIYGIAMVIISLGAMIAWFIAWVAA